MDLNADYLLFWSKKVLLMVVRSRVNRGYVHRRLTEWFGAIYGENGWRISAMEKSVETRVQMFNVEDYLVSKIMRKRNLNGHLDQKLFHHKV